MDKVSFSLDDAKFKLTERSRGRMKIQIKFSKEEAEGFKNFCKIKPEQLDDETFYKQIFFAGCNAMTEQIQQMIEEHQKQQQASEGQDQNAEVSEWPKKDEQEEE
jgi:hypothetical protein